MSGPTKGMVAGQPITTGAQTKEFDEGYERVFGTDRKPKRGRFIWDEASQSMIEVGTDWTDTERRAQTVTEELVYGKLGTSTDGAPIDSRTKHREYMKRAGVTLSSDYSDAYRSKEKASAKRADDKARRETVARAYFQKFKP